MVSSSLWLAWKYADIDVFFAGLRFVYALMSSRVSPLTSVELPTA